MYPGVELRLLRYVIAVAEELHFSRAAAKVRVAQPSLSKQIRDLEEEIGTRLFDRTNRQVRLTAAGRVFVKEAEKALAHSDRAVQLARQANPTRDGELRVGYTPRMNLRLLSAIRRLLVHGSENLGATFKSLSTAEQINALLEGSLEAGIVTLPLHHESLTVELLLREPLVAAISQGSPVANSPHLNIVLLQGIPLICRARRLNSRSHDHLLKELRKSGYTPPSIVEVTNDFEALHMVDEGLGVSFVKISAVPFHANGGLSFRNTTASLFEDTGLAFRRSNRAKNLHTFLEALRKHKRALASHTLERPGQIPLANQSETQQLTLF